MTTEEELDQLLAKIPDQDRAQGAHVDDGVLIAYREQKLDAAKLDEVEQHLASCAECRALLDELSRPVPAELDEWAKKTLAPRNLRRWAIAGSTAAALAAGILLFIFVMPKTIIDYEVRGPFGGVQELRGEPQETSFFIPGSRLELVTAPKNDSATEVTMTVLIEAPGGKLIPAPEAGLTRGEGGTFRYEAAAGDLFGADYGKRKIHLVFTVGRQSRSSIIEVDYRASEKGN